MWFTIIATKSLTRVRIDVEIIAIDLSTLFDCSSSNMSVSPTVLCDGIYHCDHFEDELACNNSATYLQEDESHFINMPFTSTSRLYNAFLLQTNTTYGFRIVFQYLYLQYDGDEVQIGTGNDPSDIQSVIKTIHGYTQYARDDLYVGTNEMWFTIIATKSFTRVRIDVEIIAIDLSTLFDCSSSNMSVSSTVLCDGIYHCDHFEDELACSTNEMWFAIIAAKSFTRVRIDVEIIAIDLSTLFDCSRSNMSVSPTVLCDGIYHCDHFEDELACSTNEMWFTIIATKSFTGLESTLRSSPLTYQMLWNKKQIMITEVQQRAPGPDQQMYLIRNRTPKT
ncbi:uncharacterized protein LOC115928483 [Strongylocentrotus purpuratus]|uniref:Uncharacterized protein n=1 Tax=Strongylocentrotus purpuratus TaxID=7668 RepID=A0A7M7T3P1_STRPU|nr:uncharacterized protein LOC115928483 [Strongylocentrotus purpuratus]